MARLVVAGGLMHRAAGDALAAPTTHASFRAANTVLQPVRCVITEFGLTRFSAVSVITAQHRCAMSSTALASSWMASCTSCQQCMAMRTSSVLHGAEACR